METSNSGWVTWAIQAVIGAVFGIAGFLFKKGQSSLEDRINKCEEKIERHDGQMANMPFVYVTRDDFIRAMSRVETSINDNQQKTDAKLDKIYDLMLELKKEN